MKTKFIPNKIVKNDDPNVDLVKSHNFISVREANEKELRKEFDDKVKALFEEFEAMLSNIPEDAWVGTEQQKTLAKIIYSLSKNSILNAFISTQTALGLEEKSEDPQEQIDYIYAALHYYNKQHCKLLKLTQKLFSFTSLGKILYEK